MVGKVTEKNVRSTVNIDSSGDDGALLKLIEKKKKRNSSVENSLPVILLMPDSPIRELNMSTYGGGLQQMANQSAKKDKFLSSAQHEDVRPFGTGETLTRHVVLAAAGQAPIGKKPEISTGVIKESTSKIVDSKERVMTPKNDCVGAVTNTQQTGVVQRTVPLSVESPAAIVVNIDIQAPQISLADSGRQSLRQQKKEEVSDVRPSFQGLKVLDVQSPPAGGTTLQSKNAPVVLQPLNNPAASEVITTRPGSEGHTLEVNYPFQRWSGDHSVKVSVPIETRREGHVTLLPSDGRAAEVLARNLGQLTSLTPDLLRPQQERDEQQQRRQQEQQQDEEQE